MIKVYHNKDLRYYDRHTKVKPEDFTLVARADTNDLDMAYQLTNNIHDSWVKNSEVTPENLNGKLGHRSTSVGDVMELDGDYYIVAMVGFEKLKNFSI